MTTLTPTSPAPGFTEHALAPLRPVRFAVAGLTRTGIVHAAVASRIPNVELVGLSDPRRQRRREVRGVGFQAPMFERLSSLLGRVRPDAIIVAAPHPQRGSLVREALEAGIPVLADRPMTTSFLEAEGLALAARERELALASTHALLFHPVFARARTVIADRALGSPRRVRCSCYRSLVFESGRQAAAADGGQGGVLAQQAIDTLAFLIDTLGMPVSVKATAQRFYGPLEDELHAMMTLASGAEAGLDASWSVPGYPTTATVLEFEGENGKLLASDDALEIDVIEARLGYRAGHARLGLADLEHRSRFVLDGEAIYRMDAAFLAWVAGGPPPPHRAELAVRVLRVTDALYQSASASGAAVPLPRG